MSAGTGLSQLAAWLLAAAIASCACCQSLVHDIPRRGALVYSRQTEHFVLEDADSPFRARWLVQDDAAGPLWKYLEGVPEAVPVGFEQPAFDDSSWTAGRSGFGSATAPTEEQRTIWKQPLLCARTRVEMGSLRPKALQLVVSHSHDLTISLNGKTIAQRSGAGNAAELWVLGDSLTSWVTGENLLAVKCGSEKANQRFSLAMAAHDTLPPRCKTVADLEKASAASKQKTTAAMRALFVDYRMPPLLLHGDLADNDSTGNAFVSRPPSDLRDLGWWMAMDLRTSVRGAAMSADSNRMIQYGDLLLRGTSSPVDSSGWQTLEFSVKHRPVCDPGEEGARFVDMYITNKANRGFLGDLKVRRRMVLAGNKVRISEFQTELTGTVLTGPERKQPYVEVHQRENWKFVEVQDGQDAKFRLQVKNAIDKGTARLKADLRNLNAQFLRPEGKNPDRSYNSGRLALSLLALIKGGVPASDPVVQKGLAELRKRVLVDTYSLGNACMAIEAMYAPNGEFGDLKQGTIDRPRKRTVSDADKALLQEWVKTLLDNVDPSVDRAYLLRFQYVGARGFDHSVNQYGLLGLYAAHLCGIELSPQIWEAAINHLIAAQRPEGPKLKLDLVDYRTHAHREANPDEPYTVGTTIANARGWGYHGPKANGELTPTYGSMTASGITGLAICQAALQDYPEVKRDKLQGEANRARLDGFAWLAQHMTMRYHAGDMERQNHWHLYYMYGVERAALLSGVALLQDRDWFFEGAMILIHAQRSGGHWPSGTQVDYSYERDAFAILFLKQSTVPVLTGK